MSAPVTPETLTISAWEGIPHADSDMRVRRFPVPGGWLYQVEHQCIEPVASEPGYHVYGWHPPVFVPDALAAGGK